MSKKPTSKASKTSSKKGGKQPPLAQLEELLGLMQRHALDELEWEESGLRVRLRRGGGAYAQPDSRPVPMTFAPVAAPAAPASAAPVAAPAPRPAEEPSNRKKVASPFVGTFYRSPSPGSDPYVKEGQLVKKGDVLCIVEAMKLMNEIESEHTGKIVSILVENGQPVEYGEPLFVVET